jgi:hypothetical protein
MTTNTMNNTATAAPDDVAWAREAGREARASRERRAAEAHVARADGWARVQHWAATLPSWWPAFGRAVQRGVQAWSAESGVATTYTTSGGRGTAPFTCVIVGTRVGNCAVRLIEGDLPSLTITREVGRRKDHGAPRELDEPIAPEVLAREIFEPWLGDVAAAVLAEEAAS